MTKNHKSSVRLIYFIWHSAQLATLGGTRAKFDLGIAVAIVSPGDDPDDGEAGKEDVAQALVVGVFAHLGSLRNEKRMFYHVASSCSRFARSREGKKVIKDR